MYVVTMISSVISDVKHISYIFLNISFLTGWGHMLQCIGEWKMVGATKTCLRTSESRQDADTFCYITILQRHCRILGI